MTRPSLKEIVLDALPPPEKGFTLSEEKARLVLELLEKSAGAPDTSAAKAVYELAVLLQKTSGEAARSRLKSMVSTAEAHDQLKAMRAHKG
jgi:hypothetical protein